MNDIKNFKTENEAKMYGKNFSKHQFEHVIIDGKSSIICGTDQAYEEELWGDAYILAENFCKRFLPNKDTDDYSDFATDIATEIRDLVLKSFEKEFETTFVDIYDEY